MRAEDSAGKKCKTRTMGDITQLIVQIIQYRGTAARMPSSGHTFCSAGQARPIIVVDGDPRSLCQTRSVKDKIAERTANKAAPPGRNTRRVFGGADDSPGYLCPQPGRAHSRSNLTSRAPSVVRASAGLLSAAKNVGHSCVYSASSSCKYRAKTMLSSFDLLSRLSSHRLTVPRAMLAAA